MKTDLKITFNRNGSEFDRSYTYINGSASNADLREFITALTAISTDTYVGTKRIITIDVDTEDFPVANSEG